MAASFGLWLSRRVTGRIAKAALSFLLVGVFILGFSAWGRRAGLPPTFPYVSAGCWLVLACAVSWLWHQELRSALLTAIGAVFAGAVWSAMLVDFPPWLIVHCVYFSPYPDLIGGLILFSPVLFAGVGGAVTRERHLLSGGLMLFLGTLAVVPAAAWNVHTHISFFPTDVASGHALYLYYLADFLELGLVVGLGVGAAALGHLVRGRVSRVPTRGT